MVYIAIFAGSYVVHTRPGFRMRSLWRRSHEVHIGSQEQLTVPIGTFLTYCGFWAVVLSAKLAFDFFLILQPLKEPLKGLLAYPFSRISSPGECEEGDGIFAFSRICGWEEVVLRAALVLLRVSVPFLVFNFDTYIFFNVFSAVFSSIIALRRKIGVVASWRHVVAYMPDSVHNFNVKLLGSSHGNAAKAAREAALAGGSDWCVEARTLEWQSYARAWNAIVIALRDADQLSNVERSELLFGHITGDDASKFFGVPEYVIFPTFVTSPVLTAGAIPLQARARAWQFGSTQFADPAVTRTLIQTRDLLLFLAVKIGVVSHESREAAMVAMDNLAALEAKHLMQRPGAVDRVQRMAKAVASFIKLVREKLQSQRHEDETGLAEGASSALDTLSSEISSQARHILRRTKQIFLEAFDVRSIAIVTSEVYLACVHAWERLEQLLTADDEQVRVNWPLAVASQSTHAVVEALHRCFFSLNPGGEPTNMEARRQLLFFCNSLFNRRLSKPPPVACMKAWSAFTPHYAEDVTYSMAALREGKEGVNGSLLQLLASLFAEEWGSFCERVGILRSSSTVPAHLEPELQRWASDRAQVLSRTVRGVMRYGEGLRVLARLEGLAEEEIEMTVACKFEYVVTCQIYGRLKAAKPGSEDAWKAAAIDKLRQQYSHNLRVAYVDGDLKKPEDGFYSILLGVEPGTGRDRVLYKVKLPGNPIVGEGKPENQNHAIIFTRGEYLQTLDMNQDNYMGESYKMRNLLECFRDRVRIVGFREHIFSESGGAVASFAAANEFVFGTMVQRFLTWPLMVRFHYGHPDVWDKVWAFSSGGVSKASKTLHVSEDIFAGFNCVLRGGDVEYLEYIHCGKGRDMGLTAVNGFEQKISAGNALQCTSRDLYRIGKHFDLARLMSFYFSGSGFYITTMFTVQAVYYFILAQLCLALCGAELFEYDYEILQEAKTSLLLAAEEDGRRQLAEQPLPLAPLHPHEVVMRTEPITALNVTPPAALATAAGSIYSAAYILQLGFVMLLPYAMEIWIEYSLSQALVALLRMVCTFSFVFSLFTMQTKGFNFANAMTYGRAGYVATGRGFQMDTLSMVELYAKYGSSHIHHGFEILVYLVAYQLITQQDSSLTIPAAVPVLLLITALMLSPWIFNPGALTFGAISTAWSDWRLWIDSESDIKMADSHWGVWHHKRLASARSARLIGKLVHAVQLALPRLLIVLACAACLRQSHVLLRREIVWSLAVLCEGAGVLALLGLVPVGLHWLTERSLVRALFPKQGTARFLLTQVCRGLLLFVWTLCTAMLWEGWCWRASCTQEEAAFRSCRFDYFGTDGAIPYIRCQNEPASARACDRVCIPRGERALGEALHGLPTSGCVDARGFAACLAAPHGLGMPHSVANCTRLHTDPVLENHEQCVAQMPSLSMTFAGSLILCVLLVQWLALVDARGWSKWWQERSKRSKALRDDAEIVLDCFVERKHGRNRQRARTVEELVKDVPSLPRLRLVAVLTHLSEGAFAPLARCVDSDGFERNLGLLRNESGPLRDALARQQDGLPSPQRPGSPERSQTHLVMAMRSVHAAGRARPRRASSVLRAEAEYYELRKMQTARARARAAGALLGDMFWGACHRLAVVSGLVADYYYRVFDLIVSLVLFALLTILSMLPLHSAQSVLLFKANFSRVIQRGLRTRNLLEALWSG